jgi:hypothetical protein
VLLEGTGTRQVQLKQGSLDLDESAVHDILSGYRILVVSGFEWRRADADADAGL